MDFATVSAADPMVKGNKSSESNDPKAMGKEKVTFKSIMEARMAAFEKQENEEKVSRSYTPLSFYSTPPTVDYHGLIPYRSSFAIYNRILNNFMAANGKKNYIPLSFFTMGYLKIAANEEKVRNYTAAVSESEIKVSVSEINSIPDKVALSILSKLPVKSLKRFECVRKSWSILFENPNFMTMYTNHFISRHIYENSDCHTFLITHHLSLTVTPDCAELQFLMNENIVKCQLPPLFQKFCQCVSMVSILGSTSVKGIFCIGQNYESKNEIQYVLWNPATGELRVIPPSLNEINPHYPQNNLYLRYDFHGFGYDRVRDDFKLIQFVTFDYDSRSHYQNPKSKNFLEIYSLNSNSWRMIDTGIALTHWFYPKPFEGKEVYLDGLCHWLVTRSYGTQHIAVTLLSFDLSDEAFITTPIGDQSFYPYVLNRRLAVLNGSIALISNYHDDVVFHISILGELGVSESWIKLYVSGPLPSIQWSPIGFGKMGHLFFKKRDGKLAYVDLSTQIIKEVGISCGNTSYFSLGLYKGSLYPIGGSSK